MILTPEQTEQLIGKDKIYNGKLVSVKLGYKFFGEDTSPLGNILCFEVPTQWGEEVITNALILSCQLSYTNLFGGVCFQRLYSAQLGSTICSLCNLEGYVDSGNVYLNGKQTSVCTFNKIGDWVRFEMLFSLAEWPNGLKELPLATTKLAEFKQAAVDSFYFLCKDIFHQTQHDNI